MREGEEWNPNLSGDLKITGEFTGSSSVCEMCCASVMAVIGPPTKGEIQGS